MSSEPLVVGSVLEQILRMQKLHQTGADVVTWIHANLYSILRDNAVFAEFNDARQVRILIFFFLSWIWKCFGLIDFFVVVVGI